MKLIRFFTALVCASIATIIVYLLVQTLTGVLPINDRWVDSGVDKLFWILMCGGCAVAWATGSAGLFKGQSIINKSYFLQIFIGSLFIFASGIFYYMIYKAHDKSLDFLTVV
jgi:hypothetical protein